MQRRTTEARNGGILARRWRFWACANGLLAGVVLLAGCGGASTPTVAPTSTQAAKPTATAASATPTAAPTATRQGAVATATTQAPTATRPAATPVPTQTPAPPSDQPKMGGTLRAAIQNMDAQLSVIVGTTGYSQNIYWRFQETLLNISGSGDLEPLLAEAWQVSPDAKTFTFNIRKGVQFHDGSKLDAAGVKWYLDKNRDPKIRWSGTTQTITNIEVADPYTIKITTKASDATLLFNLAHRGNLIMPQTAFPDGTLTTAQYIPLGTGPFKVVGARAADRASLDRFDGYWNKGTTYLDHVQFFKVTDPTVRLAGVRAGDLDIIETAPLEAADTVMKNANLGYLLTKGNISSKITMRQDFPPFDNVHFRRAIAYAIDRDAINKAAYFGLATPHANYMWPGHWGFDPNFKGLAYSPEKAREELALAGLSKGTKVDAIVYDRNPMNAVAQIVQEQLRAVGIEVVLNPFDSVRAGDLMRQGKYGTTIGGHGSRDAEPLAQLDVYLSTAQYNKERGDAYKSPEIDAILTLLRTNADRTARVTAMKQFNEIFMARDVVMITLVENPDFFVWNAKLRGVESGYSYFLRINNAWWSDKAQPGPLK